MDRKEVISLRTGVGRLGSLEELESRLEFITCVEIDECLAQYCWQFDVGYTCRTECAVQCEPFNGCNPYCYE
jgi:hypothetical protein